MTKRRSRSGIFLNPCLQFMSFSVYLGEWTQACNSLVFFFQSPFPRSGLKSLSSLCGPQKWHGRKQLLSVFQTKGKDEKAITNEKKICDMTDKVTKAWGEKAVLDSDRNGKNRSPSEPWFRLSSGKAASATPVPKLFPFSQFTYSFCNTENMLACFK